MHSDFSATGRSALERLAVPPLHMGAIRAAVRKSEIRDRVRAIAACVALAGAVGAAGLGEKIYDGIHVWLHGSNAVVQVRSMSMTWGPSSADIRNAISTATFPVIFPVGLPAGTRVTRFTTAPAQHPNTIVIEYLNKSAHFNAGFTLIDSRAVSIDSTRAPSVGIQFGDVYRWRIGGEMVIVSEQAISALDARRISTEMKNTTPGGSLAVTERLLWKTIVLGKSHEAADIADDLAPPGSRSVLLDRSHMALVPDLAMHGKPMLDSRTVWLSNIPSVNGQPDYSKATLEWPDVIAIPANGVRAIDAVLRSPGVARDGCCAILFKQRDPSTFWIWEIPMKAPGNVSKFSVDARTFAVTALGAVHR
jgi:hypothetical protein